MIALDAARRLTRFRDLATAKADELGFPRQERQSRRGAEPAPRFTFLSQLDWILRDQERRATMTKRGPIPSKGGDPIARISALIRDLDQIDVQPMLSRGAPPFGATRLVHDLIDEGDAAVEPLLKVLEVDDRLTRSVSSYGRGISNDRFVHPVYEVAFAALSSALKTHEFDGYRFYGWKIAEPTARKSLAGLMRQFWQRTRSVPLVERWYRTLLDDSAGPGRWLEAAGEIVQPDVPAGERQRKMGTRPMKGDPLLAGRDPSVSALLLRRTRDIERMGESQNSREQGFFGACRMATALAYWDEKASLPVLNDLIKECRSRSDQWLAQDHPANLHRSLASTLAQFTEIRFRNGEPAALEEYAAWLRTTTPAMLEYGAFDALAPLVEHPDQPVLATAARWLFNDPKSPWVPLLPEARGQQPPAFQNLIASPLLVVAGFREGVLGGLADTTALGSLKRLDKDQVERSIRGLPTTTSGASKVELEALTAGMEYPFRHCDLLAARLSEVDGCALCELYWPEARRHQAVAASVAYLKHFGASFITQAPPGVNDFPGPKAHLKFPILDKPATREDVASARAIFSLKGQGEARLASMPGFPQQARWITLKDTPIDRTDQDGVTRREYDTDGIVWQAEEVRKGDGWERFYGFVGHHVVARAPASEIEFAGQLGPWWNLKGGLDARTEMVEPRPAGYQPGQPILVALHIRNRLGVAHASPIELIRAASDGKPALRKGVRLSLWRSTAQASLAGPNQVYPNEAVEPKRDAQFDPGEASRLLQPLEAFEATRLDLNEWFDLTTPAKYRLRVTFAAGSGFGEGAASEVYFQIGDDE